ncbi:small GTP-binding protein domain [Kingella potus]|uniref:Small GTP-binding protein domain n=1 Tax=Kingella potus TaxID=265175 RepID=A0A377R3P6_9NEIS|nr:DUF3482 domain-containing protein [Kingella potus]STR03131.1 small GTP-binding protein domain [Kingella potus]
MSESTALSLAVVGHTNTGKTSLMRTLLRDAAFGDVQNAPSTTRHVERSAVNDGADTLVLLHDTPGLEDAGGVLDWLETHTSVRSDGIERLQQFLTSPAAAAEFNQEAKVLRQLLHSDAALYVIDAREPVLEKYKDELTVLSWCAKPVMPVFNFTAGQDLSAWIAMLARRNLHVCSSFDTVAFDFDGEIRLWQNLATMLSDGSILDRLTAARSREWQRLGSEAKDAVALFLIEAAACRREAGENEDTAPLTEEMQQAVRALEQRLHQKLLHLYRFYTDGVESAQWVLHTQNQDPFDSGTLKEYGIRTGTGAAAGALIGLGFDLATLGGSLGMGTAIGSLIGGVLPNVNDLSDKISGRQILTAAPETLTLLAARALDLLAALQTRGHAAQSPVRLQSGRTPWPPSKLPPELQKARGRPRWSPLNPQGADTADGESKTAAAQALAARL